MSQQTTIQAFSDNSFVVTICSMELETAEKVIRSCYAAGTQIFAFANVTNKTSDLMTALSGKLQDLEKCVIGATGILHESDAESLIHAGASFICSPCFIETISDECYQNKIPYIPGCMTIKEVYVAVQAGCEVIQVYPAEVLSFSFVNAVKTVFPNIKLLVSGIILPQEETIRSWFSSGASAISIGSSILRNELIEAGDFAAIEHEVSQIIKSVEGVS